MDLPEIEKHVGIRLRQCRIRHGFSQQKIAKIMGVTFQQLQKYEKGTNRVSPGKLFLVAEALSIPITEFFDFDTKKIPHHTDRDFKKSDEYQILKLFRSIEDPEARQQVIKLCSIVSSKGCA